MNPETKHTHTPPALDEATFQQLLSAAYVMQEHNARLRKGPQKQEKSNLPPRKQPASTQEMAIAEVPPVPVHSETAPGSDPCRGCGHELGTDELFCGHCGASRKPNGALQQTWASLWDRYEEEGKTASAAPDGPTPATANLQASATEEDIELFPPELEDLVGKFDSVESEQEADVGLAQTQAEHEPEEGEEEEDREPAAQTTALVQTGDQATTRMSPWGSAVKAREWLESVHSKRPDRARIGEIWQTHRGNIYLAVAAAILLVVALGLTPQAPEIPVEAHQLSAFERLLVNLGVAEAPPVLHNTAPGNPETQVWVDVRTALYYCPGADMYGKTEGGKVMSQLQAQRDQFEPSTRRACD